MEVKLSIIVPVYNAENFLNRCLDSILAQTYESFEVIALNDGSTDNSLEILKNYAAIDARIKVIDKQNSGVSASRNRGIENASGEYIAFVDADDFLEENMYELMIDEIQKINGDIVFCNYKMYNEAKKNVINIEQYNIEVLTKNPKDIRHFFIGLKPDKIINGTRRERYIIGFSWRCLFKKEIIKLNSLQFDTRLKRTEDLIFLLNYLKFCVRVGYVPNFLYNYFVTQESVTRKYMCSFYENVKIVQKHQMEILESNTFLDRKTKNKIITHLKLNRSTLITCNELKYNPDGINEMKRISKESFFKDLIKVKSFTSLIFNKGYGDGFKQLIQIFLIKFKMWKTFKKLL